MPSHAPYPDERTSFDVKGEYNGFFRVKHGPEKLIDSTQDTPSLSTMNCHSPRKLSWLWPNKIPLGKLTLIEGPPAVGKLYLALDLAARVSTASPWPDDLASGGCESAGGAARDCRVPCADEKSEVRGEKRDTAELQVGEETPGDLTHPGPLLRRGGEFGRSDSIGRLGTPPEGGTSTSTALEVGTPTAPADHSAWIETPSDADGAKRKGYVLPPDYVPPPPGAWPSGSVPDGAPRVPVPVVVICDQWEAEDMIRPRLDALGADISKIAIFTDVETKDGCGGHRRWRPIDFPLDVRMFEYIVRQYRGCRMIVIDNLDEYCPTPKQMRRAIKKLDQMAIYLHVAIVATVQRNVRVSKEGQIVDTARTADGLARCVWCVTPDPSHPGLMRLEPKRVAFCKKPQGIAFRITDEGRVTWEPLPSYQRPPTAAARRKELQHTRLLTWLGATLGTGVVPADTIYDAGKEQGFSKNKLIDAREELGARTFKFGFSDAGGWMWTFKPTADITDAEVEAAFFGKFEGLRFDFLGEPGTSAAEERRAKREERAKDVEDGGSRMEDRKKEGGGGGRHAAGVSDSGSGQPGWRRNRKSHQRENPGVLSEKRPENKTFAPRGPQTNSSELVLTPELARILEQALATMNERGNGHAAGNGHHGNGHLGNGRTGDDHAEPAKE